MRRMIIDTDTGSDDAIALIMALKSPDIKIEAITVLSGNVSLEKVLANALMTIEVVNRDVPPVYVGAYTPIIRTKVHAADVHGEDGMGDRGIIHPTLKPQEGHAVEKIIEIIRDNPGEIELVVLGPATNVALAIMKDPKTMKQVKHIWAMGTGGFGWGNITPIAEFNVYADPEAFDIMLRSGIPTTIVGFDLCKTSTSFNAEDLDGLRACGNPESIFAVESSNTRVSYNKEKLGEAIADLPDPITMGVILWPDIVEEMVPCHAHTCVNDPVVYGQVVMLEESALKEVEEYAGLPINANVCRSINEPLFKQKTLDIIKA